MAEVAISAVLSKLGELAAREARSQLEVSKDIILLHGRLEWLQAFLQDVDRKRRAGTVDKLTQVWVQQTREVVFDAEDVLDDFFHEEVVGPEGQGCCQCWKIVRRKYNSGVRKLVVRLGLPYRIQIIRSRLDQISANQMEYQILRPPTSVALPPSTTAIPAWRDDPEDAVGFDKDVEILKQKLVVSKDGGGVFSFLRINRFWGSPDHRVFVSIVGESGAGKKTLAKMMCRELEAEMDVIVRYHMEPGSKPIDLIAEVFRRAFRQLPSSDSISYDLSSSEDEGVRTNNYADKLRDLLSGKRYLLVLGGISSKDELNCLEASLPDKSCGGRVILLLGNENNEVASHANTMNRVGAIDGVHVLTRLDRARTEELFYWKVLRKGQEEITHRLNYEMRYQQDDAGDDVYGGLVHSITGGSSMAIVLLAGLLRYKEEPGQWVAVLRHLESVCRPAPHHQDNNNEGGRQTYQLCSTRTGVEIIFWVSFEDLSNDLKSCFLYLASYPTNTCQYADEVVRMWLGEGLINKAHDGKTMEEVGHDYLKELVLRCFVEVEEMKPGGGILLVRVHKSLMRFLRTEVHQCGFMEIHDVHDVLVLPPAARRLSIHGDNSNGRRYTTTFTTQPKLRKLRSFVCHIIVQDHLHDLKFLRSAKYIRVISVRWIKIKELPDQIGDMIQLRYLRLDCPDLCLLPSSIARLLNLQTLDISNTKVEVIDLDFWKIKTLRHVLARNLTLPTAAAAAAAAVVEQAVQDVPAVTNLTLPTTTPAVVEQEGQDHHLPAARNLTLPSPTPPAVAEESQRDGSDLQTLHGVRPVSLEQWSAVNCPLRNMTNIRSLEMHGFLHVKHGGGFQAALGNMPLLRHLNLKGDTIPTCVFTDQSLQSLQTMLLHGHVIWNGDDIKADGFRKFRPNLVHLKLQDISAVPQSIKQQLGTILVQE